MPQRQFISYSFYKIDPIWRRLPVEQRAADKQDLVAAVERFADELLVRTFTTVGTRGDVDFLIWRVTEDPDLLTRATAAVNQSCLAPYLSSPHQFLAMTKRSVYQTTRKLDGQEGSQTIIRSDEAPYLIVYPFVKTRPWYALSLAERQKLMDSHIEIGRKYPNVKINTSYSFGLDDQEFVVAFETNNLGDFLDLVMELRETETSRYTLRDTPTFTCKRMDLNAALDLVG